MTTASVQTPSRPVLRKLQCPKCGSPIQQYTPDAQTLVCSACHSYLSEGESGLQAVPGTKIPTSRFPIRIGQGVTLKAVNYFVMGRVLYEGWDYTDKSDRWRWDEWLLGSDDGRLLWLSLDENGLYLFRKLKIREAFDPHNSLLIPVGDGEQARVSERYPARVFGAEGELTWRAKRGDELLMVEGANAQFKYSIQVTPDELEVHEGVKLTPDEIKQAFGAESLKASGTRVENAVLKEIGVFCLLFAIIAFIIAVSVSSTGSPIADQTVSVTRTQPGSFPVTFDTTGRPMVVKLTLVDGLASNTFADVNVSVISPTEDETYITLQEFWSETGYDDGGAWSEQRTVGTDTFVPYYSGAHTVNVELDEESVVTDTQVRVEILAGHIAPNFLLGYSALTGIVGALLFMAGRGTKGGTILIVLGLVFVVVLLIVSGFDFSSLLDF